MEFGPTKTRLNNSMKIAGFIFIVFLMVAAAFLSFMTLQFDSNTLRIQLEQHLTERLHADVSLASISLRWGVTPALEMNGVQILERGTKDEILRAPYAKVRIHLLPLLRKHLVVKSFELETPHIKLFRREDKSWNWNLAPAVTTVKSPETSWKVTVKTLKASHATLVYRDETAATHYGFHLEDLNLEVHPSQFNFDLPLSPSLRAFAALKLDYGTGVFSLHFNAASVLNLDIKVEDVFNKPRFQMKGAARDLALQDILPPSAYTGHFSADWEGTGEGLRPEEWTRSLALKGTFHVTQGQLPQKVILPIFHELATIPVPDLAELPNLEYPFDFDSLMDGETTPFEEWSGKIQGSEGKLFFEDFFIHHSDYTLRISGFLSLRDRYLQLQGAMAFSPEISEVMLAGVQVMEVLTNPNQEILIPLEYRGSLPDPKIFVDTDFIANRFVETRGEELAALGHNTLNEFLEGHRQ